MTDAERLKEIIRILEPPPYGRTWCERPCCCPGTCVGCLAETVYKIAKKED